MLKEMNKNNDIIVVCLFIQVKTMFQDQGVQYSTQATTMVIKHREDGYSMCFPHFHIESKELIKSRVDIGSGICTTSYRASQRTLFFARECVCGSLLGLDLLS